MSVFPVAVKFAKSSERIAVPSPEEATGNSLVESWRVYEETPSQAVHTARAAEEDTLGTVSVGTVTGAAVTVTARVAVAVPRTLLAVKTNS